jgi:hypothetical protein
MRTKTLGYKEHFLLEHLLGSAANSGTKEDAEEHDKHCT